MTADLWILLIAALIVAFWVRGRLLSRGIAQYTAADVAGRLKAKDPPVLLDVRSASEHSARSIGGSVHIPLPELESRLAELERFRDREIVCYCASGARSASAAHLLKKKGFAAANLAGGISGWREGQ